MGTLYLVPTPIGNLKDITLRALEILKEVDLILAETPSKTLRLLNQYQIQKPVLPFFEGKNERALQKALQVLREGGKVAFTSEAGTPGISDPGQKLVAKARREGAKIEALPGPSALCSALSLWGEPLKEVVFYGYLPKKKRKKVGERIKKDLRQGRVLVFFFSPYRLLKDLEFLQQCGAEEALLLKELSKKFEEHFQGRLRDLREELGKREIKGEWTGLIK
ncbi:16S rRNA (cytidine(1402)-2'-O)-methyltransferase [bacterium]|nr:16S rRNA (cytidine(1402)-2'-O)-methyltransferase [bacterium]